MTRRLIPAVLLGLTLLTGCTAAGDEAAVRDSVQAEIDHRATLGPDAVKPSDQTIETVEPWQDGYSALVKITDDPELPRYEAYGVTKDADGWAVVEWNTVREEHVGAPHAACFALGTDLAAYNACKAMP